MNLLNYIDRYVPSAVKDLFKRELHFSDTQTSLPLTAFLICGLPGLLAAGLALAIREPPRGGFDPVALAAVPSWPEALRRLRATAPYVIAVAGYVAVTWAGGGMADWFAPFLHRYRGMN